jgi:hypothetical protein
MSLHNAYFTPIVCYFVLISARVHPLVMPTHFVLCLLVQILSWEFFFFLINFKIFLLSSQSNQTNFVGVFNVQINLEKIHLFCISNLIVCIISLHSYIISLADIFINHHHKALCFVWVHLWILHRFVAIANHNLCQWDLKFHFVFERRNVFPFCRLIMHLKALLHFLMSFNLSLTVLDFHIDDLYSP